MIPREASQFTGLSSIFHHFHFVEMFTISFFVP